MGKEDNPTEKLLEEIKVKEPVAVETKTKGRGITYTLKAFGENIKRLDEAKLLNDEDKQALAIVRTNILLKYTGL